MPHDYKPMGSLVCLLVGWFDGQSRLTVLIRGVYNCKPEHILFGSPVLICHLQLLFNGLIQHGYAPTDFLKGFQGTLLTDGAGAYSSATRAESVVRAEGWEQRRCWVSWVP